MHDTALAIGSKFLETYASAGGKMIVELGSMNINGTLRSSTPSGNIYLGMDVAHGSDVDLVISFDQPLPFRNDFADLIVSTSQMEHDSCFWLTFLEMVRITKPGGYIYINTPSNGPYHCYPLDVWRFYPDAGRALAEWSRRSGYEVTLIESFIANRRTDVWNDFVAILHKGPGHASSPGFLSDHFESTHVRQLGRDDMLRADGPMEDRRRADRFQAERNDLLAEKDGLLTERDGLRDERDALRAECHRLMDEVAALRSDLEARPPAPASEAPALAPPADATPEDRAAGATGAPSSAKPAGAAEAAPNLPGGEPNGA